MQDIFNETLLMRDLPVNNRFTLNLNVWPEKRSILRSLQIGMAQVANWHFRLETVFILIVFGACSLKSDKTLDDG